jgi:zinc protease
MRSLFIGLLAFLLLTARAEPEPVRQLGRVQEFRLANGLQLLLMPVAKHPTTLVTLTYRVGSRHEGQGEAGLAHVLEHVTFRGTARFPDLAAEYQRLAVRFNGTTTKDRTNYQSSFSPDAATLRQVLQIEAERMTAARLAEADFLKEKPIVLNEMGLRASSMSQLLGHAVQRTLFRQHPYGRPVIGYTGEIEALSLQTLQRFYRRHYRPDNAVLMIAGAFETEQVLAAVAESFGALPQPSEPLPLDDGSAAEPPQAQPRLGTLRGQHTGLALAYRVPGLAHADAAPLALLGALLLQETQTQVLPKDLPFTAMPLAPLLPLSREPYLLGAALSLPTTPSGDAAALEALVQLEARWIERVEALGDGANLQARSRYLARQLAVELARQLGEPETASRLLSDAVGAGDWRLPLSVINALAKVDGAAVRRVAKEYLRAENRNLVRAVTDPRAGSEPTVQELPVGGFWARLFSRQAQVDEVADPSQGLDRMRAAPRPPAAASAAAPASAAPATAAAPEAEPQRRKLPSGLRLATLDKPSSDQRVALLLELRWGRPEDLADDHASQVLGRLLAEGGGSGAQRLNGPQLRDRINRLGSELRFNTTPQALQLQLRTRRDSLLPTLELLLPVLREPALPPQALQLMRQQTLAQLAQARQHPGFAAQEQLRQHLDAQFGDNPLERMRSMDEQEQLWQQLTVEKLRDSQRRWWSANDARVAVVGALPAGLDEALEKLLGSWKRAELPPFVPHAPRYRPVAAARFAGPAAPGESGRVLWQQWLPVGADAPEVPALLMGLMVFAGDGSSPSGNRLGDRLRGRDAISYAVGLQLELPRYGLGGGDGDRARVRVQASGAPAQLAQVEAAFAEEFQRLREQGPSADELERVREQMLANLRRQRASEMGMAAALMQQLDAPHFDAPPPLDNQEQRLRAVTPEQVREALQRLLKPDAWVVLVTGAS